MANTYTQINIHAVFAVKGRENLLLPQFREELFMYMSGILKNDNSYPLAVGGYKDHVHALFELNPNISVSKQMQQLKASSSKWINDRQFFRGDFNWQTGYGAFSYAKSERNNVINYIMNQEEHHTQNGLNFKEEYFKLLSDFEIEYKPEYLFEFYD